MFKPLPSDFDLTKLKGARIRLAALICVQTAVKVRDLLELNTEDIIEWENNLPVIKEHIKAAGRDVWLPKPLRAEILAYIRRYGTEAGPLFKTTLDGRRWPYHNARLAWYWNSRQAGLEGRYGLDSIYATALKNWFALTDNMEARIAFTGLPRAQVRHAERLINKQRGLDAAV